MGRNSASRSAEDDRGAVVARPEIAGRSRETRLQWPAFVRILSGPYVAGGAALRSGSHERRRCDTDAGATKKYSRRRVLPVGGVGHARKYRFAHLAAQRRYRRAAVVSAERY